ncbi:hypothetical protein P280DRAFT_389845 [Massarina eburnea CBS 473.64]|uniref:Cryptic loci regulator 2 N-terminal domain-containing protein n=1 Tax=Massarina eburnea CBS 473.64 TaxID=1395130 RepID=A0A6A6SHS1_9PLEO|nr:hypothetical protein P280DRAFT_389845 [Massarina eburnea CBS 473.64]
MTQPLTAFWPIFPQKSDGQEVVNQKGKIVRNGPSEAQLDSTPNEQGIADFYREVKKDDPKHVDWRKKLGGMLLREIGGKEHEGKWNQCILHHFPPGYHLYEHIKSKSSTDKTTKNHSGGGHDRQDAYLYGYPKGPKKRFRSPIEFFPHLLWLSTDDSSDYSNCTCRICSPLQIEVEKPTPIPLRAEIGKEAVVQIPLRRPSSAGTATPTIQSPAIKPAMPSMATPNTTAIRAPERKVPTPLPQPRSHDQMVDSQYNKFVARTGEVVWFYRPLKDAWGLGLVTRRWTPRAYLVQPLSHPFEAPAQEVVSDQIKPWLAWSAPNYTFVWLQQNVRCNYKDVPWDHLLAGHYGDGVADVDASILAAKTVDTTYTLFDRLKTTVIGGIEHKQYNGIYLGGEKIWNGDPVRLRLALGTDIMVVTAIIEKVIPQAGGQATARISFTGDVYSYKTVTVTNPNAPPQPPTSNNIPIRMREDMRWRNQYLISTGSIAYWDLAMVNATVDITEIKGRWYESSILFVEYFKEAVNNNEGGNGIWMNARGDATGLGKVIGERKDHRVSAFGEAVPKTLQLIDGLEPPEEQNKSTLNSAAMPIDLTGAAGTGDTPFTIDDFMNLDGADDGGMAFGQDFNFG